jgi:hypothetical protein
MQCQNRLTQVGQCTNASRAEFYEEVFRRIFKGQADVMIADSSTPPDRNEVPHDEVAQAHASPSEMPCWAMQAHHPNLKRLMAANCDPRAVCRFNVGLDLDVITTDLS